MGINMSKASVVTGSILHFNSFLFWDLMHTAVFLFLRMCCQEECCVFNVLLGCEPPGATYPWDCPAQ